jgi:tetratricopeptide (TPR) repeat protein
MGDSASALEALRQADRLIDPEREPRLRLCIHHNLADNLSKAGRHWEAAALLPDLKNLAAAYGSAQDRLRLDWVEGRIAAGLGDHERACRLLSRVRQTFLDEGNAFEAALAALDLAVSYLRGGETGEVRKLADEMVTVFREVEVPREALAALLLFQEAARQETATAALAQEVAASLTQAQGLSCESAGGEP